MDFAVQSFRFMWHIRGKDKCIKGLVWICEGKKPVERPRRSREDDVIMLLRMRSRGGWGTLLLWTLVLYDELLKKLKSKFSLVLLVYTGISHGLLLTQLLANYFTLLSSVTICWVVQFTTRLKSNLSTALIWQTTINIQVRTNPHQTTNCTSAQCIFNWNTSVNGHKHLTVRLHPAKTTAYIETVLVSSTQQV